jgi:hypothetical protein
MSNIQTSYSFKFAGSRTKKTIHLQDLILLMHMNPKAQLLHQNAAVKNQLAVYSKDIKQQKMERKSIKRAILQETMTSYKTINNLTLTKKCKKSVNNN